MVKKAYIPVVTEEGALEPRKEPSFPSPVRILLQTAGFEKSNSCKNK